MPRRNQSILNQLVVLPWWVSLSLAGVLFILLKYAIPLLSFENMVFYAFTKAAPTWANLVIIPLFAVAAISAFNQFRKGKMLESISGPTSIKNLTWREFEELVSEAFRRKGYFVLENPDKGPDGGVDLRLRKNGQLFFVQCKHWKSKKVGVKIVRELFGVMTAKKVTHGIIVTFGEFTPDAKAFAKENAIHLIAGNQLLKLISEVQKNPKIPEPMATTSDSPICPKCGSAMKLRTAKKGKYAGQKFWGCSNFPGCHGILAYKTRKVEA